MRSSVVMKDMSLLGVLFFFRIYIFDNVMMVVIVKLESVFMIGLDVVLSFEIVLEWVLIFLI